MRAGRLVSLLLLLQTRGRMTAQQLAEELEVSVRTVYRDVESLGGAGVPIYAERGPDGGYRLLEGYRTRLTGLTSDEAETLFLTGMPGPAAELGLGSVLAAAELKLLAALPAELRSRAEQMRERFHLDAPDWSRNPDETPHLAAVAEAVWGGRRVRVGYRRWGVPEPVVRELSPLGLVLKGGLWYLVAGVEGAADGSALLRTYRISKFSAVEALAAPVERPEGFELAVYWRESAESFTEGMYRRSAVVRISSEGLRTLDRVGSPLVARVAREQAGPADGRGWVRTELRYEMDEQAMDQLWRLGAEVEVLEPAELRAMARESALAVMRLYGSE